MSLCQSKGSSCGACCGLFNLDYPANDLKKILEERTTSFGFLNGLKYVTDAQTKKITSNLNSNNRLAEEERQYLSLKVRDMTISNGEIVKYLIIEVE